MIALAVIIAAIAAFAIGIAVGRRTTQSRSTLNHFGMARLLEQLLNVDEHVPILQPEARERTAELLNEFWKNPPEIEPRDIPRNKPLY